MRNNSIISFEALYKYSDKKKVNNDHTDGQVPLLDISRHLALDGLFDIVSGDLFVFLEGTTQLRKAAQAEHP